MTFRPRRLRRLTWIVAPLVAIVFGVLGTLLTGDTGEGQATFQRSDQIAMGALGLFLGGRDPVARPARRVIADAERVRVRNVVGGYDLPWSVVRAVRFERGHPWATLELQDDDVVAVLAVQAADKDYAVAAVRALRERLAASQDRNDHEVRGDKSARS